MKKYVSKILNELKPSILEHLVFEDGIFLETPVTVEIQFVETGCEGGVLACHVKINGIDHPEFNPNNP